jgi:hypothetical protein
MIDMYANIIFLLYLYWEQFWIFFYKFINLKLDALYAYFEYFDILFKNVVIVISTIDTHNHSWFNGHCHIILTLVFFFKILLLSLLY